MVVERERLKPVPPPKPKTLVGIQSGIGVAGGQQVVMMQSMDYYTQLKILRKKCDEFRMDVSIILILIDSRYICIIEMLVQ